MRDPAPCPLYYVVYFDIVVVVVVWQKCFIWGVRVHRVYTLWAPPNRLMLLAAWLGYTHTHNTFIVAKHIFNVRIGWFCVWTLGIAASFLWWQMFGGCWLCVVWSVFDVFVDCGGPRVSIVLLDWCTQKELALYKGFLLTTHTTVFSIDCRIT